MKQNDLADLDTLIRRGAGKMTQQDIADLLGISASTVCRRMKELGAGAEPVRRPTYADTDPDADRLSRLEELRDMLYEAMQQTGGGSLANLSKEYRATLAEIELVEGGQDEEDADDPVVALLAELRGGNG